VISLIILAAGKSTRMNENKLLLSVNGETLLERVVNTAVRSNAGEVVVVLGYEAERIREKIARLKCRMVVNDSYEKGQSRSVKAGLSAISSEAEAVMVLPADVALIDTSSINKVIDEYRRAKSRIVIATYQRESGHPILLDKALFPEISEIDEQTLGLKAVINRHRAEVSYVDVGNERVLIDIDTQEQFEKYFPTTAYSHR
jgi:molybdenum cofactor cytidylyltransferase